MSNHIWDDGGNYPYESIVGCLRCKVEIDIRRTHYDDVEECPWEKHDTWYDDSVPCAECGQCDCADSKDVVAILCQAVGECAGMHYDLWENTADGTMICDECMEYKCNGRTE